MIKQNFSTSIELPDRFQRLHDLTVETSCYRLSYARSDQEVAVLMDELRGLMPSYQVNPKVAVT